MRGWIRRLRGVLGIGAIWGFAGGALGSLAGLVTALFSGASFVGFAALFGFGAAGIGFLLGASFAGVLTLLERRLTLDELTPGRAAMWGAVAGVGLPLAWMLFLFVPRASGVLPMETILLALGSTSVSYGLLTAGLAAATVALARRAPDGLPSASSPEGLLAELDRE